MVKGASSTTHDSKISKIIRGQLVAFKKQQLWPLGPLGHGTAQFKLFCTHDHRVPKASRSYHPWPLMALPFDLGYSRLLPHPACHQHHSPGPTPACPTSRNASETVATCRHMLPQGGSTAPITTFDPCPKLPKALPLFTLCMRRHLPVGVVGANFGRVQREELKSGLDGCGQWGINGLEGPSWLCRSNRAD